MIKLISLFLLLTTSAQAQVYQEYDCMLVSPGGPVEINRRTTVRADNFTSQISCNVTSKRSVMYLGGAWCIGDDIYFRGIKGRRHQIYTCHVRNWWYDHTHGKAN